MGFQESITTKTTKLEETGHITTTVACANAIKKAPKRKLESRCK